MQRIRQKAPWILAGTVSASIHLVALFGMKTPTGVTGQPYADVHLQGRITQTSNLPVETRQLTAQSGVQKTQHDEPGRRTSSASAEPCFFSANVMERHPFPVSSPRPEEFLSHLELPAAVVQLRLYIDDRGSVLRIENLSQEPLGTEAEAGLKAMFLATRFIPGNIRGFDLPSYMDIEIDLRAPVL